MAAPASAVSARLVPRLAAGLPRPDVGGIAAVLTLTMIAAWPLVSGGLMIGQDTAAFFYPVYSFLGERLRDGDIPGWNPYQFAGIPFAADPESGWMYLPAMLLFTLLPLTAAAKTFLVFHLALAGLATYALGRILGLTLVGSLVAAVAYEFTGLLYGRSVCCPVYLQASAWVPATLLGIELAIRARSWTARACWWGATGLALSQIFASWLGQGSYYALLTLGTFVLYRTVLNPPVESSAGDRWLGLLLHGAAPLLIGLALAAAGILPRLEFHGLTNLATGYDGDLAWAASLGGWLRKEMAEKLLGRELSLYYAGGATAALALIALLVAKARLATPYFAFLSLAALVLSAKHPTRLHSLLYTLLPEFEDLHTHWPERIMVVFYLGPALLAGATVSALPRWHRRPALLVFLAFLPVLALLHIKDHGTLIPRPTLYAVIFACLFVAAYALLPLRQVRRLIPILLLLVIFVDLRAAGRYIVAHGFYGGYHKVDLDSYYDPAGAAEFLQSRGDVPVRYFGYDPQIFVLDQGQPALYRYQFVEPRTTALVVNNRATLVGIADVQGYNPLQLQRYVEYVNALNGHPQEYHGSYVLAEGLDSPLLDLLSARYIVVPAQIPASRTDLQGLVRAYPVVYEDAQVKVLENTDALPRAWIVHDAVQVERGEALPMLSSGAVDPRATALLEEPPPALDQPADPAADEASITHYEPDGISLRTHSDAAGLLVLSEIYYPAWEAYVDGEPVELYLADHTLRAVPIPAGEHVVELRYESRTLQAGLAISLAAYGGLGGLLILTGWKRRR